MVKLIALLKRKPGMTRDEFAKRWVEEHTRISSMLPGLRGYRINIATPRQPEGTDHEPLYDGTAEMWWDSIDDMEASFNTELGRQAGDDGYAFTIVRKHLYTEEYKIVPGPEKAAAPRRRSAKRPAAKKTAKRRTTSRRTTKRARK
ncbi:MAG: EthD family reductase [Rudaea sp.]